MQVRASSPRALRAAERPEQPKRRTSTARLPSKSRPSGQHTSGTRACLLAPCPLTPAPSTRAAPRRWRSKRQRRAARHLSRASEDRRLRRRRHARARRCAPPQQQAGGTCGNAQFRQLRCLRWGPRRAQLTRPTRMLCLLREPQRAVPHGDAGTAHSLRPAGSSLRQTAGAAPRNLRLVRLPGALPAQLRARRLPRGAPWPSAPRRRLLRCVTPLHAQVSDQVTACACQRQAAHPHDRRRAARLRQHAHAPQTQHTRAGG